MARICYGEFDYPEGQPEDRILGRTGRTAYLRNEFLKAVHKHVPEVWEELYGLRELFSPLISARLSWPVISRKHPVRVRRKVILKIDPHNAQTFGRLSKPQDYMATAADALLAWASRWNLNEEWCLQRAYDALQWWTRHGKVDAVLWTGANWGGTANEPKPEPHDGLPEYRPLFEFREDYLQSIRSNGAPHGLLTRAKTYCEKVERSYERAGYIRCKANEKRNLDQHLEWTVRFQVRRESLEDIGNAGIEPSTVLRGVYDLLRLIYLSKRADAVRGRRYGSKNNRSLKELGR